MYIFMLEITVNHFVHSFDNVPMYHLGVILSQFSFLGTQTTHRCIPSSTLFHAPRMGWGLLQRPGGRSRHPRSAPSSTSFLHGSVFDWSGRWRLTSSRRYGHQCKSFDFSWYLSCRVQAIKNQDLTFYSPSYETGTCVISWYTMNSWM